MPTTLPRQSGGVDPTLGFITQSGGLGGTDPLVGSPGTVGSGTPWGTVPQIPNPITTAGQAISGDIANLPGLFDLGSQLNQFNTLQAIQPYITNLPGYQDMVKQSSENIGSLLQGNIPPDVLRLLQQQGAERGVAMGSPGSPNAMAGYLQGLGLTSLGLQQTGEQNLTSAIQRTPVPQLFNVASFLTSPADLQAAKTAANVYAAAPDPNLQAQELMKLFTQFMSGMRGAVGTVGGMPNLKMPDTIPPGGPSTAPPVTVSGGGPAPATTPPTSFWDWWAKNQPPGGTPQPSGSFYAGPNQGTGTGTTPGFPGGPSASDWQSFLSGLNQPSGGTTPGFLGGPSPSDWQGFMSGLNPGTTPGFGGGSPAPDQWMGFLSALNQPNTPGFGGGSPTPDQWQGFLGGLNPSVDAANTWFGLTPEELAFLNDTTGYDVSTPATTYGYDQGYGAMYGVSSPADWAMNSFYGVPLADIPAGTTYNPTTDQMVAPPSWSSFEQDYFNQFLE